MYRVLLPDDELTLTTRIEFFYEGGIEAGSETDKNGFGLYVYLKMPQTSHYGLLILNLTKELVEEVKSALLVNGFYDFQKLVRCNTYLEHDYLSEKDFIDRMNF